MIRKIYGRFMPEAAPESGSKAEQMFAPKADHDVDQNVDQPTVIHSND